MHKRYAQVSLGGADEGGELALVLAVDVLEGDNGGGLLVDDRAETSLALNDDVGDTHLAAEGGEEDNELDGVDIVGDDDESGLLGLDEGDAVVQAILCEDGLLGVLLGLALCGLLSSGVEAGLLLLLRLGAVLVEELEELGGRVLVQSVGELGNGRGHLEALGEDDLLALQADVLRPLHKARQVSLGLDVAAYSL